MTEGALKSIVERKAIERMCGWSAYLFHSSHHSQISQFLPKTLIDAVPKKRKRKKEK